MKLMELAYNYWIVKSELCDLARTNKKYFGVIYKGNQIIGRQSTFIFFHTLFSTGQHRNAIKDLIENIFCVL